MTKIRLTAIVENTADRPGLLAEAGLAIWIECGGKRILFDTGLGEAICPNAKRLGVPLETMDAIVLSHGHYDHTRGLAVALAAAGHTTVYAHPAALQPKYSRHSDGLGRDVGMSDVSRKTLAEKAEIVWVEAPTDVCEGFHLTGPVPRVTDFENTGGAFFKDPGCAVPDDLIDDQAAFIETPAGSVVILGCAHSGVVNILRYVKTLTGNSPIHMVIGGMHLLKAGAERMDKTVAELRRLDVRRLLPCHCTGSVAVTRLWSEFPDRCENCQVGTVVEVAG